MARKKSKKRPPAKPRREKRRQPDTRLALVDVPWLSRGITTCQQCGASPPAEAHYCGVCGQPLQHRLATPLPLRIALPIVVAFLAFITFVPALEAQFVNWDDDKTIIENPRIRGFDGNWAFTKSKMGHYHPLTWLSYGVDHAIGAARYDGLDDDAKSRYQAGLDPKIFHLNNLLLHAGVGVAFYFLARLLLCIVLPPQPDRQDFYTPIAACVAALLFACHPLRVENAVWVTERRDVLSAIFLLPCLHCYLRYALTDRPGGARIGWYLASVVLLLLSLLSKAWGITLPAVMLVLDYHPLRRFGRDAGWGTSRAIRAYLDKIPFVALAVFFAYRAKLAQASQLSTMKSLAEWGVADRVMQFFYGLFFYSWKTLVPVKLTPLVQLPPESIRNPFAAWFLIAAAVVILVAVLLVIYRKRWPAGVVMGICYVGVLSPILGVVQSGPQLVADKYAYIGCLVWPLTIAGGLLWLWRARTRNPRVGRFAPAVSVIAVVLCATCATLAFKQTKIWDNSYDLWAHAVKIDPQCVLGRTNLGMLERQKGNVQVAIAHYEAAIEVKPDDAILLNNYAYALRQDPARDHDAIKILRRAIKLLPKLPDLHFTLANTLDDVGETEEAIAELRKCIRLKPNQPHPKYYRALGRIFLRQRKLDAAEKVFKTSLDLELKLNPNGKGVIHAYDRLGWIMIRKRQPDAAIAWFEKILEIDPDNSGARKGIDRAQSLTG